MTANLTMHLIIVCSSHVYLFLFSLLPFPRIPRFFPLLVISPPSFSSLPPLRNPRTRGGMSPPASTGTQTGGMGGIESRNVKSTHLVYASRVLCLSLGFCVFVPTGFLPEGLTVLPAHVQTVVSSRKKLKKHPPSPWIKESGLFLFCRLLFVLATLVSNTRLNNHLHPHSST